MPKIYDPQLGRYAALGVRAVLTLTTDLTREWASSTSVGSTGGSTGAGITELTGDVTAGPGSGSQTATIANDAVTYAKFQNISAASRLLGRGSTGGSGNVEEITLGTNLTMTGTTLSASAGTSLGASFVAPVDGDFAWINQGPATVDTTFGGIFLSEAANPTLNFRIRKKSAPSTPYVITAGFLPQFIATNFHQFGLVFRQSSDGKLHAFSVQQSSGRILGSLKYTSATSFSAVYNQQAMYGLSVVWLRIADNGTNRICSFSHDGFHWDVFATIGRTDFLTADEVGFFIDVESSGFPLGVTLVSWEQT